MKIFKDRKAAGKLLAKRLRQYKGKKNSIVLGIPRGGVVVAAEVAKSLKLTLDIIVTRKIGAPSQPELALGAVDADGEVVWDKELLSQLELKIESGEMAEKIDDEMEEIKRREREYRQGREPLDVKNKVVILVDDGIATGATTLAAIRFLRRHQAKKIVLAVPVASRAAIDKTVGEFGEVLCLEIPEYFQAVGQFYHHFEPVTDSEVIQLLNHEVNSWVGKSRRKI